MQRVVKIDTCVVRSKSGWGKLIYLIVFKEVAWEGKGVEMRWGWRWGWGGGRGKGGGREDEENCYSLWLGNMCK